MYLYPFLTRPVNASGIRPSFLSHLSPSKTQFEDPSLADRSIKIQFFFLVRSPLPAVIQAFLSASLDAARETRLFGGSTKISERRDNHRPRTKPCTESRETTAAKTKKKRPVEEKGGREGPAVLTDLGRCNFREDPLRRWVQLVGALTRPLSHQGASYPLPFSFQSASFFPSLPLSFRFLLARVAALSSSHALACALPAILLANLICLFLPSPKRRSKRVGFQPAASRKRVTAYPGFH